MSASWAAAAADVVATAATARGESRKPYVGADGLAIEAYSFYEDVCDRVAADGGYETMRADCKSFDPSGARVVSTAATFCADAFCPGGATLFATLDDGEGGVFVARALGAPCGKGHCGSA